MQWRKVLFLVTEDWYFYSHRLPIARAARDAGYCVTVAAREQAHAKRIRAEGFTFEPIRLRRNSLNPFKETRALGDILRIYADVRPDLVHHVAIKPVLYGSLAARITGVPAVINAMPGLGTIFTGSGFAKDLSRRLTSALLARAQPRRGTVMLFQNEDDRALLVANNVVVPERSLVIHGSGVDVAEFRLKPAPSGPPLAILPARMLWEKGVGEFVEAARILRRGGSNLRFALIGPEDPENPSAIPRPQLEAWNAEGTISWWGGQSDMPAVYEQASIVCLPSYREGLPKALLEGAATGRPLIATDVPGCREIVRHGDTGLLVPPRDVRALVEALWALASNPEMRSRMGRRARAVASQEFSDAAVARATLALYDRLIREGETS